MAGSRGRVNTGKTGTEVIDHDVILLWNKNPRIISGTDILGRLFRGIGMRAEAGKSETHEMANTASQPLAAGAALAEHPR